MDNFYLDTSKMDGVIGNIQQLAKTTEDMRGTFQKAITNTATDWSGEARTMFDKKAHMLMQQLTDVSQSLFDIAETLINTATAYMEVDTQAAKEQDGKTERVWSVDKSSTDRFNAVLK